jgi:EmrB/QacA subfamily drug resistance transporter
MSAQAGTSRKWWILFGVGLGVLMSTLDATIVNIALPTLVQDLNASFGTVQWVVLSYLLVLTSLTLGVARLGDMYGKKRVYLPGLVIFVFGSALCGFAPNVGWLIGFRALQGLGGVMVAALGAAIVTEVFPGSERGRAIGIIGSLVSVGVALGPSLGGVLIEWADWHWIFLVNVPIGIIAVAIVLRFVPNDTPERSGQRFDIIGAVVLAATLGSYALGMTLIENNGFSVPVISLLVGALVGLAVFLLLQMRLAQPMIRLDMFRNILFSMNLLMGTLVFIAISANLLILPFYLEQVKGFSTAETGLLLAVVPIATAVVAPISGSMADRHGPRPVSVVGLVLISIGYVLLSLLRVDTSVPIYLLSIAPVSVGLGVFQSPNNSAVLGSVSRERLGVASGLLTLSRTLGQTTGVPLMGALFAGMTIAAGAPDIDGATGQQLVSGVRSSFIASCVLIVATLLIALVALRRSRAGDALTDQPEHDEVLVAGE